MSVYIIMTILAVVFSYTANIKTDINKEKNKNKMIFWYISELILIIVAAIRYDVGQDYMYTYVPYFNGVLWGTPNENIEIGFFVLNKIVQIFTQDYVGIFIVCSVIFFHYIYKAIRDQSTMPAFSIFLLISTTYYFIFLNAMRQMLVVAIFFYAIKFIKERKFIKYLIYMLIASTLHTSALILIPIYFIYGLKMNPIRISVIAAALIILKPLISEAIIKIIQLTKYNYYIDSKFDTGETGYVVLLINVCVIIFAMIYYIKKSKESELEEKTIKDYSFYCYLQLISILIAWYNNLIPLLNRIRWCVGITIIILIPLIINREKNPKLRLIYIFLIVMMYSVYYIYTIGFMNANNVLPYQTIFQRNI